MKKTIYGCTLIIIGTMLLLGNISLYLPVYMIGILFLIFGAMSQNNKEIKRDAEYNDETSLVHLRDIGVFSNEELEEAIKLFNAQPLKNREYKKYLKYLKVLNELKERGSFADHIFKEKVIRLKDYYNID